MKIKENNLDNQSLQELVDLINLAEEVTLNIDQLTLELDKSRVGFISSVVLAYVFAFVAILTKLEIIEINHESLSVIVQISSMVFLCAGLWYSYRFTRRIRAIKRDLRTESDIQEKLISLIDETYRIIQSETKLTPIVVATLELRLRRLDRSDREEF